MLYSNCEMHVFRAAHASYSQACTVRLDDDRVRIEYDDEGSTYAYYGRALSPGHYSLEGEGFEAKATLHHFDKARILEGSWNEEGNQGMWRIRLSEQAG